MSGPSSGRGGQSAPELVLMGRIGAAHGIRGEVRIQSFCANPLDIAAYGPLQTKRSDRVIEVEQARLQKSIVIATLRGIRDRSEAERLNGTELFVPRDRLPAEDDEDNFYYADLIGLEARLADGTRYGTVKAVDDFGAGDVIELKLEGGGSDYFEFSRTIFPEVHVAKGYLVIVPPAETFAREGDEPDEPA